MKGMGYLDPATGHVVDPTGLTEYSRYRAQYLDTECQATGRGLPTIELALGAVFFVIGGVVALAAMLAFWAIKAAWRRFQLPGYEWVFREGRHANRMTLFELIFLIVFSPIILPITLLILGEKPRPAKKGIKTQACAALLPHLVRKTETRKKGD